MKKLLILLSAVLCLALAGCASTGNQSAKKGKEPPKFESFPYSTYNVKAGEEVVSPVNCGYIFYGKTQFVYEDWDYSIPEEFGDKTLVVIFGYSYYYNGQKEEVYYEMLFRNIDLKPELRDMPVFSYIKAGDVIGTASADNPEITIRTENGLDPNLLLDSNVAPVDVGDYTYFSAATLTSTSPKYLSFQPVSSRKDEIEFWDYPESLESLTNKSLETQDGKATFQSFPNFGILVKTQLSAYPEPIHTTSSTDLLLRNQFYSQCETELTFEFDGLPFHIVFQPKFLDYLKDEYKLGDDIYLFLNGLYSSNGVLTLYVREFSILSPEELYENKVESLKKFREQNNL